MPPNATTSLLDGYLHLNYLIFTGKPGFFIHIENIVEDIGIAIKNLFSPPPPIYFKEAASKARGMLCMMRRSFVELSVSGFVAL